MRRHVPAAAAPLAVVAMLGAVAAAAQTPTTDRFAADFAAEVAAFKALADFSTPSPPTPAPAAAPVAAMDAAAPAAPADGGAPYSLPELLAMGAARNASVRAAAEGAAAALAQLKAARARRLPTLSTDVSGTWIGNPVGPVSLTAGELGTIGGVLIPPEDMLLYQGMESTLYRFSVAAEVPIFTWGKISLGIDLAQAGLEAAELQRRKSAHEMGVKIRGLCESLAYLREACRVLELQTRIGRRLVELAEANFAAGFLTAADLLGVRIRLKETDLATAHAEESRDRLLSELASLVGLPELGLDQLELKAPVAGLPRWSADQASTLISEGSYDLAALAMLVESKRKAHALARAEARGLPDIGLRLEASYGGSRFPLLEKDWFGQDDYSLNLSLGTSTAALGNAVKAGEAAKAAAEIEEALAKQEEGARSVRGFVRETYLAADLDRAKIEYAALRLDAAAADLAQRQVVLRAGAGSESEYLTAMSEALGVLAEAWGTMTEYRSAILALEAAAGSRAADDR